MSSTMCYDQLQAMRHQEQSFYKCTNNYINNRLAKDNDNDNESRVIDDAIGLSRVKMCEWCYEVAEFCHFQKETVLIAMSNLDRWYVLHYSGGSNTDQDIDIELYQLAAMTALYMAVKSNEVYIMNIHLLVQLGRGVYCKEDFEIMELNMLQVLQWRINAPTSYSFIRCYVDILKEYSSVGVANAAIESVSEIAFYQADLAVTDNCFIDSLPSHIALAALLNAISISNDEKKLFVSNAMQDEYFRIVQQVSGLCIIKNKDIQSIKSSLYYKVYGDDDDVINNNIDDDEMEVDSCHDNNNTKPSSISCHHPDSPVCVTKRELAIIQPNSECLSQVNML